MDHGFTDTLDHLAFALIGVAVLAAGFGSFGSISASTDPIGVPAAAAAPVAAAVASYDVVLNDTTWRPAGVPVALEPAAPVEVGPGVVGEPHPAVIPAVVAQGTPDDTRERPPSLADVVGHHGAVRLGAADAPASRPKRGRRCQEPPDPLIVSEGPGSYVVREAVVQRYTRDWSRLGDLGWSEVHRGSDGKADGMKIGGIRCGSDPWDAGFRSGDVIHSVNGRRVHNVVQAIGAYTALHGKRAFEVELTRNGARETVRFRLL
jgi:hypothetical protein